MRRRLLALLASGVVCLGTALVVVPPAHAAWSYQVYEMCADDADGQECVLSATRNGVPVTTAYPSEPGTHEWFYVDNGWRDGIWGFNLNTITVPPVGDPVADKGVDGSARWVITVNTGATYPRELNAKTRNTVFTRGGNAATGYWFRIEFNPVPIAWRYFDGGFTCDMTSCGNDSTVADFVSGAGQGFADGYVTDLADSGLSAGYKAARTGFVLTSNAQYQGEPTYDAGSNSIVVQMANPHLRAPGVPATGFFETYLPDAYLRTQLGVPDPDTLTGGTFTVWRDGVTTSVPFTLTDVGPGIWIRVHGIGFSRPKFKLHAGPSKPRKVSATKISVHKARVRFTKPAKNLGYKINKYQARCHKLGKPWRKAKGTASSITVGNLPKGKVYCQVRAHNKLGWGVWSATKRT